MEMSRSFRRKKCNKTGFLYAPIKIAVLVSSAAGTRSKIAFWRSSNNMESF
jgi:hypothetical protein